MKIRNIILSSIVLSSMLTSCYKDEDITAEKGSPRYAQETGTPIDDACTEYYNNYNRFILYKFKGADYQWDIADNHSSMEIIPCFNYGLKDDIKEELKEVEEELAEEQAKLAEIQAYVALSEQEKTEKQARVDSKNKDIEEVEKKIATINESIAKFDDADYQEERKQEEKAAKDTLKMGYDVLKKVFLDLYSDEFKRKNFPYKIILGHTASENRVQASLKDLIAFSGRTFVAMGKVRKGINELTGAQLNEYKSAINSSFWGGYLQINNKYYLPNEFYKVSDKYYYKNLLVLPENKGKKREDLNFMDYGFWKGDKLMDGGTYMFTPKADADIAAYMDAIFHKTQDEFDEIFAKHPVMKQKYDIIVNHIKNELGFDLREIAKHDFTK
ncbi:MAG: hypothetical protein N4A49_13495 [Marinifilaceae bacterium]|jgi:hypothetical protein|nr:hypothetical protein [Marinifilaceae bacterium]